MSQKEKDKDPDDDDDGHDDDNDEVTGSFSSSWGKQVSTSFRENLLFLVLIL